MRSALLAGLAALILVSPARAQSPSSDDARQASLTLLPHYTFHLNAGHLSSADPRYVWDTNFGGEVDLLGWSRMRATFTANYQAVLGEEIRAFDPNQGNYILAGSLSARVSAVEVTGVFHHESRHLGDRPKRAAVAWNMAGARVAHTLVRGPWRVMSQGDLRGVVQRALVDYRWEAAGEVRARRSVAPSTAVIGGVSLRHLATDGSRSRGGQTGTHAEGGLRFDGRQGALELYVAHERVVDPFPLEFSTARWWVAGFRLLSRD